MRKFACSFLILWLCQLSVAPQGCRADDGDSNKPAESKKAGKTKKGKQTKANGAAPASANSSGDNADLSVDQTLDQFLGKPTPPSSTATPPEGATAPQVAPAPDAAPVNQAPTAGGDSGASSPVDKTLDLYLGKNAPTKGAAIPQEDSEPTQTGSTSPSMRDGADSSGNAAPEDDGQTVIGDRAIPENALRAGELNNSAIDAMNSKNFQKAIDLLREAVVIYPGYTQGKGNLQVAYFNYGVDLYNNQKYAEAIPFLEKALAIAKELKRDDADLKQLYADCKQAVKETSGK